MITRTDLRALGFVPYTPRSSWYILRGRKRECHIYVQLELGTIVAAKTRWFAGDAPEDELTNLNITTPEEPRGAPRGRTLDRELVVITGTDLEELGFQQFTSKYPPRRDDGWYKEKIQLGRHALYLRLIDGIVIEAQCLVWEQQGRTLRRVVYISTVPDLTARVTAWRLTYPAAEF